MVRDKNQGRNKTPKDAEVVPQLSEHVDARSRQIDEPHELAGTNQFANPQEYLMSALNACMMVGYVATAALLGIHLTKLEVRTQGDIDLRGLFDIDPSVKNGYDSMQQTVHIAGDATPEQFAELHEAVLRTSVNYFNITQAVPVHSKMVVE